MSASLSVCLYISLMCRCVSLSVSLSLQVTNMKANGLQFLCTPDIYYDQLKEKLRTAKIKVAQDIDMV